MLLKALVNYYELLIEQGDTGIPQRGSSMEKVSFALNLSEMGELLSVRSLMVPSGKKEKLVPRMMMVPKRVSRSGVTPVPNFLCDNASFVLGIDNKGNAERTKKCFQSFYKLHSQLLGQSENRMAKAIILFLQSWNVEKAREHPLLAEYLEEMLKGGNLLFYLDGQAIHENKEIISIWMEHQSRAAQGEKIQCLVTGNMDTMARLHPVIKGIYKGQAMGNQLVSFNADAYESYGKKQGANAQTGEYAAFAYGTALNYLLADEKHKMLLGNTTVVFWAETLDPEIKDIMGYMLGISADEDSASDVSKMEDKGAVKEIKGIMDKISQGETVNYSQDIFADNTNIYVVGLTPNAARLSMRFFDQDTLGAFAAKMAMHYEDMAIQKRFPNEFSTIPIWKIIKETVPINSKDKSPSPLLAGTVLKAILDGREYPVNLYQSILGRIRAEQDVTYVKAAIIKGYLLRKYKKDENVKEVLTMSLNEESGDKIYLLGRLFSVLEKLQTDANSGIKATIAEKYLASAGSTPAKIFPLLLKLSTYHIAKSEYGTYSKMSIEKIMDKLEIDSNPFPSSVTLDEQGKFYLGYYQQNIENYKRKSKEEKQ